MHTRLWTIKEIEANSELLFLEKDFAFYVTTENKQIIQLYLTLMHRVQSHHDPEEK